MSSLPACKVAAGRCSRRTASWAWCAGTPAQAWWRRTAGRPRSGWAGNSWWLCASPGNGARPTQWSRWPRRTRPVWPTARPPRCTIPLSRRQTPSRTWKSIWSPIRTPCRCPASTTYWTDSFLLRVRPRS